MTTGKDAMKLSEMIKQLEEAKKKHGDLDVKWEALSHRFEAEVRVVGKGKDKFVQVN